MNSLPGLFDLSAHLLPAAGTNEGAVHASQPYSSPPYVKNEWYVRDLP